MLVWIEQYHKQCLRHQTQQHMQTQNSHEHEDDALIQNEWDLKI